MPMNKKTLTCAIVILVFLVSLAFGLIAINKTMAQSSGSIFITSDGYVIGTNNIQRNGNVYTLIGNIFSSIQVQKSYIVIDGAGYSIQGTSEYGRGIDLSNGAGQDPSRSLISN